MLTDRITATKVRKQNVECECDAIHWPSDQWNTQKQNRTSLTYAAASGRDVSVNVVISRPPVHGMVGGKHYASQAPQPMPAESRPSGLQLGRVPMAMFGRSKAKT
jgi:hypothetical protein